MPCIDLIFLNQLKTNYNNFPVFIETGTCSGDTILSMEPYFNKLYTIEISNYYYNIASSKYNGNKINFILGDSSKIFIDLLPNITEKSILFLDGHYSSGDTGRGDVDVPLYDELKAINNFLTEEAIIIIDDARLFGKGLTPDCLEDWTGINTETILKITENRITDYYFLDSSSAKNDRLILHLNKK